MTNKFMYVVFGQTGDYEGYATWPVEIYSTPEEAQERVEALALVVSEWNKGDRDTDLTEILQKNGDGGITWDADGSVEYNHVEVPFIEPRK